MNTETIKEFLERLKTGRDRPFTIDGSMYAAVPVLKGKLVYASYLHDRTFPGADTHLTLAAVIDRTGTVHIVDKYRFGCYGATDGDLPDGAAVFPDHGISESASLMLNDMADAINTYDVILSEDDLEEAKRLSWLLALDPGQDSPLQHMEVSSDDHISMLLGEKSLEGLVMEHFNEARGRLARQKAVLEKARAWQRKYEGSKDVAIYRAVSGSQAKFLAVTFTVEGRPAAGRLSPDIIKSCIRSRSFFSPFQFQTSKSGEGVYEKLFGSSSYGSSNKLYPSYISEIKHGRNVLYRDESGNSPAERRAS